MDLQVIMGMITLIGSAGIAWGVSVNRLKALEIRLAFTENEHRADHDLLIEIKTKLDMIIQRIDKIESRMDSIENRMGKLENEISGLKGRIDGIENRMNGIENRMGKLENEMSELKVRK